MTNIKQKEYAFVLDNKNNKLAPTNVNKAWILIRKQKAVLIDKYPMVIQLKREVKNKYKDNFICGIDDGSKYVGIALIQKCKTKNKSVFKGTIELRQDVKSLMDVRKGYRKYHRSHKRYRKVRFNNRIHSKRKNRIAPTILQKKQSILRVINRLNKYIDISEYHLEDVAIDIRALTEGHKLYKWQYQKSNRLDENIRKAVILRDNCKCMECGKSNCILEVHHITPKRLHGDNNLNNLITLCSNCHQKTEEKEELFIDRYYKMINGKNIRFDYAQHVMQGKTYLRNKLKKLGKLIITKGGDTANKRIDWNIKKSHSNDALVITDLKINTNDCNIKDWIIKPMRRKFKGKRQCINGIIHRDLVSYTNTKNEIFIGYVTAMYQDKRQMNVQTPTVHLKRCGWRRTKLLWRFNKIYWF